MSTNHVLYVYIKSTGDYMKIFIFTGIAFIISGTYFLVQGDIINGCVQVGCGFIQVMNGTS